LTNKAWFLIILNTLSSKRVLIRSHLKNRILVQDQGGAEVQPAGILKYSEELKRGPNIEVGPKDFFEIASINN
jgi:hypothetical protein